MSLLAVDAVAGVPFLEDRTPATVARLRDVVGSGTDGVMEWERPGPSAAFSRRDAREPGFADAMRAARDLGFEPFVRPVGGRLAAYHDGALVLDLLLRDDDPRPGTTARFRVLADVLALGLRRLGADARVGAVPGEYCPGDWSVNAGGTLKLVGTGQRLVRDAVLLTAVVVVGDPEPLREVMVRGYRALGLALDPRTVGALSDVVPGVTTEDVVDALGGALAEHLPLDGPDIVGGRRLLAPWSPR